MEWISRHHFALAGILVLSGCSYIPVQSLGALSRVDPLRIDGATLRLAVVTPADLGLARQPQFVLTTVVAGQPPGTTRLTLGAVPSEGSDSIPRAAGQRAMVFRLDGAETTKLSAFQENIRQLQAKGVHGHVDVTADIRVCQNSAGAPGSNNADVYLRTSSDQEWVPVLREVPRAELAPAAPAAQLQPCL